jgi:catalase
VGVDPEDRDAEPDNEAGPEVEAEHGPADNAEPDPKDEPDKPALPSLRSALTRRGALIGMGAVAGFAAVDVGAFAYAGGWLRPDSLTPPRFTDRFESVYGRHDGFRRNHAKGLSVTGSFASTGLGAVICRAAVFQVGTVPLIGRFSLGGGLPDQADKPETVRGLGLLFQGPGGQQWRTAMLNIPVFTDSTPQGFYERMLASKTVPETGKPDPQKLAAFLDQHPETAAAMKIIKRSPASAGFGDSTFNGLNAFHFTNTAGVTVPVRWSAIPQAPVGVTNPSAPPSSVGRDYLFDDLIRTLAQRSLTWQLVLTIGEVEDTIHDATKPWPNSRLTVNAGTITINAAQTEEAGNARDINFDPTVLPDGMMISDDPLLAARSAVYARSFTRRAAETKSPSEVNVSRVLA